MIVRQVENPCVGRIHAWGESMRGDSFVSYVSRNSLTLSPHAMSRNLILVTNNIDEFKRIDGLKYEDWLAEK